MNSEWKHTEVSLLSHCYQLVVTSGTWHDLSSLQLPYRKKIMSTTPHSTSGKTKKYHVKSILWFQNALQTWSYLKCSWILWMCKGVEFCMWFLWFSAFPTPYIHTEQSHKAQFIAKAWTRCARCIQPIRVCGCLSLTAALWPVTYHGRPHTTVYSFCFLNL